jgi:hypothetical protein
MGSSRPQNSTRAEKARSVKRTSPSRRWAASPSAAHTEPRIPEIGTELRDVAARLKRIEAYLIVAGIALDESAGYSGYVAVLLRSAVGNLLFKQIRCLEQIAARCDGGPSSDRDDEDDPAEDEDSGGLP